MKPLILKPTDQQVQSEPPKITVNMVEQIADKAAHKAADEAALKAAQQVGNEAMESFNRFQEQNKIQDQVPMERNNRDNRDSIYEESEGGYSIDTKTEKNLMRRLLDQTLQKALEPPEPSPIEHAVTQVMTQVSTGIAEKMLGNLGGGVQSVAKPGIIGDILNSPFGANLGTSFGQSLPQIIQSLTGAIGQQKAQELASAATKAMSQPPSEQQKNVESSNTEKQKDMILALDVNNPEHVAQYATAMGLSQNAAKEMLQNHQNDILKSRKNMSGGTDVNVASNNEITQALTVLIQEMNGLKQTVNTLQNEIVTIKTKKPDVTEVRTEVPESMTDDKWSDETSKVDAYKQQIGAQQKSVNIFSTPIKVDVDQIKGNVNSFFEETPKDTKIEEQEESVLEEIVDDEGKSTFKMSDEQSKKVIEPPKEQPKKVTEISKEQPKSTPEVLIETEQDKKKESSSTKLIEEKSQSSEGQKIEEQTPKEHIIKKIIKKPIPIKKDVSNVSSHVAERYDINNNLISEDNIK